MKFKLTLPEGSKIPPFYGHAYTERYMYPTTIEVFYLVPFNWFFKWFRRFSIWWYNLILKRDWVDIKMQKYFNENKNEN